MKIRQHIWAFVLCAAGTVGCVKDQLYAIPTVGFDVDWSGISAVSRASELDSIYLYLYPRFDYTAEPMVIKSHEKTIQCSLLPGSYDVLMHNAPLEVLQKRNELEFENFEFYLPPTKTNALSVPSSGLLHMMSAEDPMHRIEISKHDAKNRFTFTPVTVTKRIRFKVYTSRFGEITSAYGVLSGVATRINARTWDLSPVDIASVRLPDFSVNDSTLTGGDVDVLGFNPSSSPIEGERIELMLYVSNKEVDYPLEQPIDLTDYLKDLKGDEIEITITVPFIPFTNALVVLREWVAGSELEIGMS